MTPGDISPPILAYDCSAIPNDFSAEVTAMMLRRSQANIPSESSGDDGFTTPSALVCTLRAMASDVDATLGDYDHVNLPRR